MTDTWLTKMLPEVLAKYLRPVESRLVMYHSVPKILSRKREEADVFLRYWQEFISPAELFYAHSQMVSNDLRPSNNKTLRQRIQFTRSKFSYEHCWQVTPSPLQPLQNRLRHLKQRKSNTVTGVEHVGFAHTSPSPLDVLGIEDQNAPVELDVVGGSGGFVPTVV